MEFFIDSADIQDIKTAMELNLCDGVTTNPSLVAKMGRPYKDIILDIVKVCKGPVSAEVLSMDFSTMMKEAKQWHELAPNIVVKIPLTLDGLRAVKACSDLNIKTNVTLCFSATQALLAAKAGATYISPFVGRLDDIGMPGLGLIEEIKTIYDQYSLGTKILVASIRSPMHVKESALMGAHVSTLPLSVLKQLIQHPLTDKGLEIFIKDSAKIPS